MNPKTVALLFILSILTAVGVSFFLNSDKEKATPTQNKTISSSPEAPLDQEATGSSKPETTFTETKSNHFLSSAPKNNQVLKFAPNEIKVFFNTYLDDSSTIKMSKNNEPFSVRSAVVSDDRLNLSVPFPNKNETGSFKVEYKGCGQDKKCDQGSFGFIITAQ